MRERWRQTRRRAALVPMPRALTRSQLRRWPGRPEPSVRIRGWESARQARPVPAPLRSMSARSVAHRCTTGTARSCVLAAAICATAAILDRGSVVHSMPWAHLRGHTCACSQPGRSRWRRGASRRAYGASEFRRVPDAPLPTRPSEVPSAVRDSPEYPRSASADAGVAFRPCRADRGRSSDSGRPSSHPGRAAIRRTVGAARGGPAGCPCSRPRPWGAA